MANSVAGRTLVAYFSHSGNTRRAAEQIQQRIVPFCTHEGSRTGRSVKDIAAACPGATVLEGVAIRGSEVQNARVAETVLGLLQQSRS